MKRLFLLLFLMLAASIMLTTCKKDNENKVELPTITTLAVTEITATTAKSGGNVTNNGDADITAKGIVWSTTQNPSFEQHTGLTVEAAGACLFQSALTGLSQNTTYYVKAYATNSAGTAYGSQVQFTTETAGGVFNDVYNPATGKTWMDRNLGAGRVAQSSADAEAYGDLYQWGRLTDSHEKRNSGTTSTLSNGDLPGHGNFILAPNSPYDWRSMQNNNLWQGVSGTNNPCPAGYRLPTEAEWNAERQSWSSNNAAGAFNSPLKLPVAGLRGYSSGSLSGVGSGGLYWSATVDGTGARYLYFLSSNAGVSSYSRAYGLSVRCLKD